MEEDSILQEHGSDIVLITAEVVSANVDSTKDTLNPGRSNQIKGALGELEVAAFLLRHGYEPYFPLSGRNAKHDLLAVHIATGKVCKLQVKCTTNDEFGSNIYKQSGDDQILALVKLEYTPSRFRAKRYKGGKYS